MSSDSDSDTDSETSPPVALHLGDIVLAKSEWKALASVGRLRVGPIRSHCRPFFFPSFTVLSPSSTLPILSSLLHLILPLPNLKAKTTLSLLRSQELKHGRRDQFLRDCKSGVYDGVVVISRTFDSIEVPTISKGALIKQQVIKLTLCSANWSIRSRARGYTSRECAVHLSQWCRLRSG